MISLDIFQIIEENFIYLRKNNKNFTENHFDRISLLTEWKSIFR